MEEKKFPWLLRLLSTNTSCVQLLETFAIHREKIISSFSNNSNYELMHRPTKSLPYTTLYKLIEDVYSQTQGFTTSPIKHVFFIYKSKSKEASQSLLKSFSNKKKSIPPVSYVQVSKVPLKTRVEWEVEYTRTGLKSAIKPESAALTVLEQAKEISREIISLVELHEDKKVLRMSLEFILDHNFKLILSYMPACILASKQKSQTFPSNISINPYSKSNELSDIVNELSSPSKILKRQPSIIKVIDRKNSFVDKIEIDSPIQHQVNNSIVSEQSSSSLESEPGDLDLLQNKRKKKYDKDFLEILCKTRIVQKSGIKKYFISENELEDERDKIVEIIQERNKKVGENGNNNKKGKGSVDFRGFERKKIAELAKVKSLRGGISKRSGSMEEIVLPVLTSRLGRSRVSKLNLLVNN